MDLDDDGASDDGTRHADPYPAPRCVWRFATEHDDDGTRHADPYPARRCVWRFATSDILNKRVLAGDRSWWGV